MTKDLVTGANAVLLLGGAGVAQSIGVLRSVLDEVKLDDAPVLAADGGAALARAAEIMPDVITGDFDSLSDTDRDWAGPARLVHNPDQDSTDFDKSLAAIRAPLTLAVGFTGARLDHQLAVMTGLTLHPDRRCVLVGEDDVTCLCPPEITLDLPPGTRVSLFPMGCVHGTSSGLEWPIDNLEFRPDARIGTSNRVSTGPVRITVDAPAMLLILPRRALRPLLAALSQSDAQWPVRAG